MKKYDNVLKRVNVLENKLGIRYAKVGGKLYVSMKVFYMIAAIYTLVINALFLLGQFLVNGGTDNFKYVVNDVVTISICSAALLASIILVNMKQHVITAVLSVFSSIFCVLTFKNLLEDYTGVWGMKISFYWRHLVPLLLIIIFVAAVTIIALRDRFKHEKLYKKVVTNIYNEYNSTASELTDEQWDEFLTNYDPASYKKQFAEQASKK